MKSFPLRGPLLCLLLVGLAACSKHKPPAPPPPHVSVVTVHKQDVLNQQLTLLLAEQNLSDTQALLAQSSVALVRNLGGGWDYKDMQAAGNGASSKATAASAPDAASDQQQASMPPPR